MERDVIVEFLKAPIEERARIALDEATAPAVREFLGGAAYEEYAGVARRVSQKAVGKPAHHLADKDANLIFIPGVMGSQLFSEDLGGVWWIDARTRAHLNDLRLNADGTGSEDPNHQVRAFTTDPTYEPFLAAVLEREDFNHVVFPYDWRMSLSRTASGLRDRILEIHGKNGGRKLHLVAHSMGGLLLRAMLAAHGAEVWPKIDRIVFLATPHYGSPAIAGYLKNHLWGWDLMALLGLYLGRPTFRSLWGVLQLLPAPRGIYPGTREHDAHPWRSPDREDPYVHPCVNFDLYRAESWDLDLDPGETSRLQRVLDGAAAFHRELFDAHRQLDQELRDRMAVIAGVGQKTLFRLAYEKGFFGLWERMEKTTSRIPGNPHRDGDGRVTVASAKLENVGQVRYVRGVHGSLPTIPAVYKDVFRWLNKQKMELPSEPSGALQGHLADDSLGSETPHLAGAPVNPGEEDPGYWRMDSPTREQLEALQRQLEQGAVPAFNLLHIL